MAPLAQLLVAATMAGLAAAVPHGADMADLTTVVLPGGTASLQQVRREDYKFNGAMSTIKAYRKYGARIPGYLHRAVARARTGIVERSNGSVVATSTDEFGSEFTIPVSIGTPPQVLNLILDTGSSETWGFSTLTPPSKVRGQHLYNPKNSSTADLQPGATWNVSYGDASSASGVVYNDTVDIGGVVVCKQAVEAAKDVSSEFTSMANVDGLLGMGFQASNHVKPTKVKTWFDNAVDVLHAPLFTADLKPNTSGTYNLGYIDESLYHGNITYVNVTADRGSWNFSISGYAVGDGPFVPRVKAALADTGTSLMYVPLDIVSAYYAQVAQAVNSTDYGGYVFPCNTTLPSFSFGVGEARVTVPGKYINAGPAADGNHSIPCYGSIQWGNGFTVWGAIALKSAFVVFNRPHGESPSLGWANKTLV